MAQTQPSHGNAFAGDLLERSAAGYAGFAASLMLERDPGLRDRHGPDALAAWRSHLTQRVLELAAAVLAGEPRLVHRPGHLVAQGFQGPGPGRLDLQQQRAGSAGRAG